MTPQPPARPPDGDRATATRREFLVLGAATAVSALSGALVVLRRRDRAGVGDAVAPPSPSSLADPPPPSRSDASQAPPVEAAPDGAAGPAEEAPVPEGEAPPEAGATTGAAATIVGGLCRASWRASPAGVGTPHTIEQITVHHSAAVLTDNRQVPGRIRGFQRSHQTTHGWSDLAYHYVIDAEGNVYEGRSTEVAGDTATNYDPSGHFLALCDGNFEEQDIPQRQMDGLARLLAWAVQQYGLSIDQISGHKDHAATACPGEALYARLQSGELADQVSAYLAAGVVELRVLCGPEADARVRAIESGVS